VIGDGPQLSRRERGIKKVVSWLVALLYERVEVYQPPGATAHGPELGVANHFGGFADPLLLIHAMDRVPRFIASDVIWRYPVAGRVLSWVGAIPVHKRDDAGPGTDNRSMFAATHDALGDGDLVVIFPEGITVDDPSIARIKTGAARIALGARAAGVDGLQIIPAGIHYEDKASLRSKVFVNIGHGISLDVWPDGGEERETVVALTEEVEARLRRTAPNFVDWREAKALSLAAEVAIRNADDVDRAVGYAERERIAARLSRAAEPDKASVVQAVARYDADLDALGIGDRAMYAYRRRPKGIVVNIVLTVLVGLLLLPFALVGLTINIVPMVLLWLVGRLRFAPAMFATVKPLAATLFFGVAWAVHIVAAWRIGGIGWAALNVLLLPFYLFALVAVVERGLRLWRSINAIGRYRRSRSIGDEIYGHRTAVVEAVVSAL
jgi:glycerol-3-phosphate O-acyltransferase / dihydroxyacetone phosphate acyltransferase